MFDGAQGLLDHPITITLEKEAEWGNPGNDRRIDNIEFAVSDVARSREFYSKAFGWTFTDYGPTYCEFSDGRLTGGLAKPR